MSSFLGQIGQRAPLQGSLVWEDHRNLKAEGKITLDLIIQIFRQIKETNTGFRSPQAQIVIRQGQSEYRTGEVVYTPPTVILPEAWT